MGALLCVIFETQRTTMALFTALTPFTSRAIPSAVVRWVTDFAEPESITVPLSVSTPIELATSFLLSTKRPLTCVLMAVSLI